MDFAKLRASTEPFVWGGVTGAIALAFVGFTFGGWVTGGKAETLAVARGDQATVAALVPICVSQFKKHPDMKASLAKLKGTETWEQAEYVQKGGWATMPGAADASEPSREVADACADALKKLVL